jgi:FMN-dependent oxidoreductase (nitrilotriacetate monooxygenase family)
MSPKPMHLAWFTPFKTPDWLSPWAGRDGRDWMNGKFYADMARRLEEACFDYMMFEDSIMVSKVFRGTSENELKFALHSPKSDPVPLIAYLAGQTKRIGLIATISTSFWEPYNIARMIAAIDHLSEGRVGWNIVTSSEDAAAKNYGKDLAEHDTRYDQADEFVDIVKQLWASWEPDAIVMDRENNVYADYRKVHEINYVGKYFSCQGPLNIPPGPQGQPVICQAGGSPRGMDFAAENADTILAIPKGVEAMKAYRDGIRERMEKFGRNPDDCKVMFIIEPVLGSSMDEAEEKYQQRYNPDDVEIERRLGHRSITTEIDFSQFDLDAELPADSTTNGHKSSHEAFVRRWKGHTLREAISQETIAAIPFKGTPDSVAEEMGAAMEEIGGDGFLVRGLPLTRHYVEEIAAGLVPALQKRGLMRTSYDAPTLRGNLRAF